MKNIYTLWIAFLSLLFVHNTHAQTDLLDEVHVNELIQDFKSSYKAHIASVESSDLPKKIKKKYKEDLSGFSTEVIDEIQERRYFRDQRLYPYIDSLMQDILIKNPEIDYRPNILLARDNTANAFCMIDGTFIINTGLIHFLENQSQVTSILCHELAHKLLDHSRDNVVARLESERDKSNKKRIDALKKQKYNKTKSARTFLKKELYADAADSRKHEFEADSLGFLLYQNTDNDPYSFVRALALRSIYDTISTPDLAEYIYYKTFDIDGIAFDSAWLTTEDFSQYTYLEEKEELNADSLRTHPEDSMRVEYIKGIFNLGDLRTGSDSASQQFINLRRLTRKLQIDHLVHKEQYGFAVFICLYRLQSQENSDFYHDQLKDLFLKLYRARKNYRYNRYVESVNPRTQPKDYQQLLSFLWNLSLTDLETIAHGL